MQEIKAYRTPCCRLSVNIADGEKGQLGIRERISVASWEGTLAQSPSVISNQTED